MTAAVQHSDLPAPDDVARPVKLSTTAYPAATYVAPAPTTGNAWITDGEDGFWQPGWADGARKGYADEAYWSGRGYRMTYFAPHPAAPQDGVTV